MFSLEESCLHFSVKRPVKFLTVQQALDYMESLHSEEFSGDESTITCLPPDPGKVIDQENIIENDFDEIEPVDVCGEVELNVKKRKISQTS